MNKKCRIFSISDLPFLLKEWTGTIEIFTRQQRHLFHFSNLQSIGSNRLWSGILAVLTT